MRFLPSPVEIIVSMPTCIWADLASFILPTFSVRHSFHHALHLSHAQQFLIGPKLYTVSLQENSTEMIHEPRAINNERAVGQRLSMSYITWL